MPNKQYGRISKLGKEKLQEMVNNCNSVAGLLEQLGYKKTAGGSYFVAKKYLQLYNINTEHWTSQGWNKDKQLKDWSQYSGHQGIKKHLIKERNHKCEMCSLDKWREESIPLEIHHKDGNRTNNSLDNLQILCPNCHALTDSWRGRNKNKKEKINSKIF